ncbi:twin-arginine translocase subunit TatC [Thiomicrorhabdus sediminis]|uniref:Sec-independent protein translocase protein TatC n=1 Tax=Thiomicrorhabdus sediminis TaxID=2580412 RepID=A0A4P9K3P4_9GAMM|nr:twin-arginine translocase subunit TatC [Thiomicrorhabdus sediminis]QCU89271.1 twin-arginine translocase subunit TatC [Thiomicrorhabdus sediminis]
MSNSALPPQDKEMTLVQHLLDLKSSLTRGILAIIVFFLILFPFANDIYTYISEPLTRYLPEGTSMIATAVASPFLTPFKLSFVLAIYLAMPFLLYQLWRFIAPALYKHERQLVAPILFFSSFLFYSGGLFAYYVVFPLVFGFLSQTAPEGVTIATDISLYLDFVIKMFFAFGMAFEVPIVTVLLILTGWTSPDKMSHARPYIIVGAFVLGMLLTPPDIISQTLLAVPMWLLFEVGLLVGAWVIKRRKTDNNINAEDDSEEPQPSTKSTYQTDSANAKDDMVFDNRYADQVDDDFDWDEEFDNIDSEMSKLDREYESRKQTKKDAEADANDSNKTESNAVADNPDQNEASGTSDKPKDK